MRWTVPCAVHCGGCGAIAQSEVHFARFAMRTPRGPATGNLDQPMVPVGWSEAVVQPSHTPIVSLERREIDVLSCSPQELADKSGIAQPVFRCPACSERATDRSALASAGLEVSEDAHPATKHLVELV